MIDLKKNIKIADMQALNFVNLAQKDKAMVRIMRNHRIIRSWMYSRSLILPSDHARFMAGLKHRQNDFYWLVKKENEILGVIYLNRVNPVHKQAYLGIYANPFSPVKGKGQCLMKCLKFIGFHLAGLHTIKLEVMADNKQALRFYRKCGFKKEGRLKEFIKWGKGWKDVLIMGNINKKGNSDGN